ncbi:type IV pilin protein [Janthinobacterium fluminis]|uniref:Type IV pilin protein n=1 Tax=Janthinobacterium fluminis TaxID=2987524 RepID=A0ABT5K8A4_9BURK|nr:type IV pilin protein [Janthinobacterium fluminis]MDC8759987.1 type IV pilin protein [Janthinobacterium fluminis]
MKYGERGFTLMEVLITLAIVGIMTAVALPMYTDYVLRGRLTEAFSALAAAQPSAEQYWSNGRTFVGFGVVNGLPPNTDNFGYALSAASASAYTITATGTNSARGFVFTIDQNGARATTAAPTGWVTNAACWVDHKEGTCSH